MGVMKIPRWSSPGKAAGGIVTVVTIMPAVSLSARSEGQLSKIAHELFSDLKRMKMNKPDGGVPSGLGNWQYKLKISSP